MPESPAPSDEASTATGGASPGTQLRVLADLRDALTEPVTPALLRDFAVASSEERQGILSRAVWGSIRWSKSLGRPLAEPMTAGFSLALTDTWDIRYVDEHGAYDHWVTIPLAAPMMWDGPDSDAYHRITYVSFNAISNGYNKISAELTAVRWLQAPTAEPGFRYITPADLVFEWTGERAIVLPEQEVLRHVSGHHGHVQAAFVDE